MFPGKNKQHNPSWSPLMKWFSLSEVRVGFSPTLSPVARKLLETQRGIFLLLPGLLLGPSWYWTHTDKTLSAETRVFSCTLISVISGFGERWGDGGWLMVTGGPCSHHLENKFVLQKWQQQWTLMTGEIWKRIRKGWLERKRTHMSRRLQFEGWTSAFEWHPQNSPFTFQFYSYLRTSATASAGEFGAVLKKGKR